MSTSWSERQHLPPGTSDVEQSAVAQHFNVPIHDASSPSQSSVSETQIAEKHDEKVAEDDAQNSPVNNQHPVSGIRISGLPPDGGLRAWLQGMIVL